MSIILAKRQGFAGLLQDVTDAAVEYDQAISDAPIAIEAAKVRATLGRSDVLVRLFDFLLAHSLADTAPKEIEIAREVFGKGTDFDTGQDASVRVYAHRLRHKIDSYYTGFSGPRLVMLKGQYRLVIESTEADSESMLPPLIPPSLSAWHSMIRSRWLWLAGAVVVAANVTAWLLFVATRPVDPARAVAGAPFWQTLATKGRPTFIVTGDYYIYGEAPDQRNVTRLVREFSINSRDDLDRYVATHPDLRGQLVDVALHYLPTSTARALGDLLPIVNAAATRDGNRPWILTGSELTAETLKGVNIVYVGFLSGLNILRDPVFATSGFTVGDSYDELIDRASGKRFTSDWGNVANNAARHRDYAYLASVPGASGNRVLVVAGTRDAGVMQAAEIAQDRHQLDQIARLTGNRSAFEALYEVYTLGDVNVGSKLVLARPLRVDQNWKSGQDDASFPDQPPPGEALPARKP